MRWARGQLRRFGLFPIVNHFNQPVNLISTDSQVLASFAAPSISPKSISRANQFSSAIASSCCPKSVSTWLHSWQFGHGPQ